MSNNKTLKVFSSTAVAGMIAAAMMSSQAFAAVDAYSVKVGNEVYKYSRVELEKSFLDAKSGEKAALYEDFTKKLGEAKGFYAFNDTKNGYVDYKSIEAKFLESKDAGKAFDVNAFTESKDAKVLEVKTVKKAVVNKDGKVEYKEETSKEDEKGELQIKEVKALNLKQVKIEFNKAVTDQDKIDDIEDEKNYTIDSSERDELKDIIEKVEMDQSGKFAIITFADKSEFFSGKEDKYERPTKIKDGIVNQEMYKITFDEDITGKEIKKEVKFNDTVAPTVEEISVAGDDTIKVKFSEPIKPDHVKNNKYLLDEESFKIDNGDISVNSAELVNENKEVNLKLGTTLKNEESLKVEVRGTVEDYAGFGVQLTKKDIKVKEDTVTPEVIDYRKMKKGEVTLVFNRDIKFKDTDEKIRIADQNLSKDDLFDKNGKIKGNVQSVLNDFKDSHNNELKTFEEYYHTNSNNEAYAVKIDGKELTMYFDEESAGIPNGPALFNIKSGEIETLWEKDNFKILYHVKRDIDTAKPKVKSVEQDKDDAKLVKVKFTKELDDKEARNKDNYTLKDEDGSKVNIDKIDYNNDDKEVKIIAVKDLESKEYKLTIEGVEDKYGNVIETVSKKFKASEKDARQVDDLTVNIYNPGENDQKMVVDFDIKMKTGNHKYSVEDLSKYTLIAKDDEGKEVKAFKGNKSTVNIEDLYNKRIKAVNDGSKVEIDMPYKSSKDDSYDFSRFVKVTGQDGKTRYEKVGYTVKNAEQVEKDTNGNIKEYYYIAKQDKAFTKLELQVGKVSDCDENVNSTPLNIKIDGEGSVKVKDEQGQYLVRAISPEEIQVIFDDKIDLKNEDIQVGILENEDNATIDSKGKVINGTFVDKKLACKWNKSDKVTGYEGKTVLTMKLDKKGSEEADKFDDKSCKHVLRYDGTLDSKKLFVNIKKGNSKNDYDAKLEPAIYKVQDFIAPALVDNNNYKKASRYSGIVKGDQFNGSDVNSKAVEYYTPEIKDGKYVSDSGAIVLSFEEKIDQNTVKPNTFILDKNSDYDNLQVKNIRVSKDKKRAVIFIEGLTKLDKNIKVEQGFDIIQNAPISDVSGVNRGVGNQIENIKTEIAAFTELSLNQVSNLFGTDKPDEVKSMIEVVNKQKTQAAVKELSGNKLEYATLKIEDNTITATVKDAKKDAKLVDLHINASIGNLKPSKVKIGGQEYDVNTKKEDIKKAVAKLAGKAEDKFNEVTLADLQGKSIEATINGVKYTLEVPAAVK